MSEELGEKNRRKLTLTWKVVPTLRFSPTPWGSFCFLRAAAAWVWLVLEHTCSLFPMCLFFIIIISAEALAVDSSTEHGLGSSILTVPEASLSTEHQPSTAVQFVPDAAPVPSWAPHALQTPWPVIPTIPGKWMFLPWP